MTVKPPPTPERVHTLGMFQRVLVAYDGSDGAKKALEAAVGVAYRDSAELIGLAIEAHLPHYGATVGEVEGGAPLRGASLHPVA